MYMEYQADGKSVKVHQGPYIRELIKRFDMEHANTAPMPAVGPRPDKTTLGVRSEEQRIEDAIGVCPPYKSPVSVHSHHEQFHLTDPSRFSQRPNP